MRRRDSIRSQVPNSRIVRPATTFIPKPDRLFPTDVISQPIWRRVYSLINGYDETLLGSKSFFYFLLLSRVGSPKFFEFLRVEKKDLEKPVDDFSPWTFLFMYFYRISLSTKNIFTCDILKDIIHLRFTKIFSSAIHFFFTSNSKICVALRIFHSPNERK